MKEWITPKGTTLPIMDLRGKPYLQVAHRLVWFREEHPAWTIETEFVVMNENHALARAVIRDESGRAIAMAHKQEDRKHFADFIEKAETGSIGRALALCGFGTQFCADEIDEGARLADSPTIPAQKPVPAKTQQQPISGALHDWDVDWPAVNKDKADTAGDYVVQFGNKFKGQRMGNIKPKDIEQMLFWLENEAAPSVREKKEAQEFEFYAKAHLQELANLMKGKTK